MTQTLTKIKTLLARQGLRPKHWLGQHFLHDANKIRQIIEAAAIRPGDRVLEVGAGTGTLSEEILAAGANLISVEVDLELKPILTARLSPFSHRCTFLFADVLAGKNALNEDLLALLADGPYKLVANLPYQVASPLLVNLAVSGTGLTDAVVMVQRDVANRLTSPPGRRTYGPLGVIVQAIFELKTVTTLPPDCFWPRPKVDSTVLHLSRHLEPLTDQPQQLAVMVQRLFQKRRKQIGGILDTRCLPAGIAPTQRPEELSVRQLVELSGWE